MRAKSLSFLPVTVVVLGLGVMLLTAEELKPILLPAPQANGGKPLMQVLAQRRTTREFKADKLPDQVLANLLWAAFGVNRPESGHRTAPSAMNSQEVDIYVALPGGLYLYEAKPNRLKPVVPADLRRLTTGQAAFQEAPVTLIFVADLSRLTKAKPESRHFYAGSIPVTSARMFISSVLPRASRQWCMTWTVRRWLPR